MNSNKTRMVRSGRRLTFNRTFDAPRDLVWQAWLKPEHLEKWYGPDGFSITIHEMDARSGGVWRFTLHGPDGRDYPNRIEFLELKAPELLVYQHTGDENTEPVSFSVRVTFEADEEQTKLTMQMVFISEEELERVVKEYGAIEGAQQTLARLANALETLLQN